MSGPGRPAAPALEVRPVHGLPEVVEGDDLAALIAGAADLREGDVVVVAQKIVSKAEGATVELSPEEDVTAARRRLAVEAARRVVADAPFAVVVETPHGLVCANGGIDASNVPEGRLLLLPADPDASARRIRDGLRKRTGATVAVIVSDTFGRPWRLGQTDVAIGAAGITPIRDERGTADREGRVLEVTEAAIADEVAAAADLVRRKGDGVPVVVVRGLDHAVDEDAGAADLVRPAEQDLFRRGRGALADALANLWPPHELDHGRWPEALRPHAEVTGRPPRDALHRALDAADGIGRGRVDRELLDDIEDEGDGAVRVLLRPDRAAIGEQAAHAALVAGAAAGAMVAALLDLDLVGVLRLPEAGEPGADRPGSVVVVVGRHAEVHEPPSAPPPPRGAVRAARPVAEPPGPDGR